MGAWGVGPLDNDTAADWLTAVIAPLADQIGKVLTRAEANPNWVDVDTVRAAAWLYEQLGHVYAYDIYRLDEHRQRLLVQLMRVQASLRADGYDEFVAATQDQFNALQARGEGN